MDDRKPKRFHPVDAIVLVAATAFGLAMARAVIPPGASRGNFVLEGSCSVLLLWTLTLVGLNLSRYRVPRRELACRPGFAAGVAFLVERSANLLLFVLIDSGMLFEGPYDSDLQSRFSGVLHNLTIDLPYGTSTPSAVASVWIVMATAGCWRAEKTWIDRLGRACGISWLLGPVIQRIGYWAFRDAFPSGGIG